MANYDKKEYKPAKYLDVKEALGQMTHIKPASLESEVRVKKDVGCMHHDLELIDPVGKKPHQHFVKSPIRPASAIIVTTDAKTKKWSFCIYFKFFRNWPVRDAEGEDLMSYVKQSYEKYCVSLDSAELLELKKKIMKGTKQYDQKEIKDVNEAMAKISTASRLKDPILIPVYDDDYEVVALRGQENPNESPYCIIKMWERDMREGESPSPDDLILNGGRQKMITKVYDRTTNFHTKAAKTEEEFGQVSYHKGSSKNGKQFFTLEVQLTLMGMTAYFPMEKRGDCQFKCSIFNATKKITFESNFGMSAESEQALLQDMLAYDSKQPALVSANDGLQSLANEEYSKKAVPIGIEHNDETKEGENKREAESKHEAGPDKKKSKSS